MVFIVLEVEVSGQYHSSDTRPIGESCSYEGGIWGRMTLFCLGKVGMGLNSPLSCLPIVCAGSWQQVLHWGHLAQWSVLLTIQVELLHCSISSLETLGVIARSWESLAIIVSFYQII